MILWQRQYDTRFYKYKFEFVEYGYFEGAQMNTRLNAIHFLLRST